MVLIEFRIPIPLSVDEFHRGQLHMVAQKSLDVMAQGANEGVEWIRNEPYDNTDGHWGTSPITGVVVPRGKGQYTLKRFHVKSKLPSVAVALVPTSATFILEESWNAYPHCRTVLVSGYLSVDKFRIDVETLHVADDAGALENALSLDADELATRKVELLNIADAYSGAKSEHPEWNALTFKSAATGRGPLPGADWFSSPAVQPKMCAYKLVRCKFNYFPIKGTVEGKITDSQRGLFCQSLCQTYATLDMWVGKSMADIRGMEAAVAKQSEALVEKLRAAGAAPPLKEEGYWLARAPAGAAAGAGAVSTA